MTEDEIEDQDELRNAKAKSREKSLDTALIAIMSQVQTRRWVWEMLTFAGCFRSSFDRSALVMSYNEGQRNVGQKLLADITRVCPDSYMQMVRENGEGK